MTAPQEPGPDDAAIDAGASVPAPLPIGGWLRIVALFLAFITMLMAGPLVEILHGTGGAGSSVSPLAAAIRVANFAAPAFILVKFLERRRYVPPLITAWCLLGLIFAPVLPLRSIPLRFAVAALLVPYFSLSKRVKRTFLL